MLLKETLKILCETPGVAGAESAVADVVLELLRQYDPQAKMDSFYNVTGVIQSPKENQPMILLDAHMDEIGLIVTHIEKDGFVRVALCGGVDRRTLAGQEVILYGKKSVVGIISSTPPHLKTTKTDKLPEVDQLLIDTGLGKEKLSQLIALGDRGVIRSQFHSLLGTRVVSGAMDDRCGVATIFRVLELLKNQSLSCGLSVLFSTQEEVGQRGAAIAGYQMKPDIALCVDVSFAKTPDTTEFESKEMGKGVMIGIAPTLDGALSKQLSDLAQQQNIPYQLEVMSGLTGTNADFLGVVGGGVRTGLLSIPLKYMHTPIEMVDLQDCEKVAELIVAYCKSIRIPVNDPTEEREDIQ